MPNLVLLLCLSVLGILSRLLPHPANFTPLGALALFSGYYFKNRGYALLPLVTMAVSDLLISGYYGPVMFYVYAGFALTFFIGRWARGKQRAFPAVVSASLLSSVLFFLITNLAVWLHGQLYSPDLQGLIACYLAALPFFRNSLLGDLSYTAVFFGALAFVRLRTPNLARRSAG